VGKGGRKRSLETQYLRALWNDILGLIEMFGLSQESGVSDEW
jgi:hypothetical protein